MDSMVNTFFKIFEFFLLSAGFFIVRGKHSEISQNFLVTQYNIILDFTRKTM